MTALLDMKEVTKQFGGLTAVSSFTLQIHDDEIVGLIGPNGAGKTTVFNLITGVYELTSGSVAVMEQDTKGMTPDKIVGLGVARTFQNIRLFPEMTVLENVKTAYTLRAKVGLLPSILRTKRFKEEEATIEKESLALLKIMELDHDAEEKAGSLAYGEQRRLEIARALATNPKLLILDEPAAGMNPQETDTLMSMLRQIRENFDVSLLLIEHDMKFVMKMCERIVVLDYGKIIARGTPEEIRVNEDVIKAYLGDTADGIKVDAPSVTKEEE